MTLDQLLALKTILSEGSFRAAAEKLNKAQSAVSYAIRNLEKEMGVQIFSRDTYRPSLTEEGAAFYQKSLSVLSQMEELQLLGQQLAMGQEPLINLSITALAPLPPLINKLKVFSDENSATRLKLSIEVMGAEKRLFAEEADLAIAASEGMDLSHLQIASLGRVAMVPITSPNHPLAKIEGELSQSDLLNFVHIILKSSDPDEKSRGIFEGAFTWGVTDFLTKKELLLGGVGWGLMPIHLVEKELESGKLICLNTSEYRELTAPLYLVRKREKPMGPVTCKLWELLQEGTF